MWMLREIKGGMRMNKKYKVKKGITLLEVLISLAIFAIVATPVATMVIKTVTINQAAENKQKAMIAAQKVMEEVKAVPEEEIMDLVTYSSKLDLNIVKDEGKKDSFSISGKKDGYLIEGQVIPVEEYLFNNEKKPQEPIKFDVEISIIGGQGSDDIKVKYKDNYFTESITTKTLDIVNNKNEMVINGRNFIKSDDFDNMVKISLDENTKSNFTVKGKNQLEKELSIFCYKDVNSNATINVENNGGKIKAYKNLYTSNNSYRNTSRIYKIIIKATDKKGETYEVSNYKSVHQ